jgi:hypothetical protein
MLTILVFEIKDGKNAQKVKKNTNCNLSLLIRGIIPRKCDFVGGGGHKGGLGGHLPPSLYVKKGPDRGTSPLQIVMHTYITNTPHIPFVVPNLQQLSLSCDPTPV